MRRIIQAVAREYRVRYLRYKAKRWPNLTRRQAHRADQHISNAGFLIETNETGAHILGSNTGGNAQSRKENLAQMAKEHLQDDASPVLIDRIDNWVGAGTDIIGDRWMITKNRILHIELTHPEAMPTCRSYLPMIAWVVFWMATFAGSVITIFYLKVPQAIHYGIVTVWLGWVYKWLPLVISRILARRADYFWRNRRFADAVEDVNRSRRWAGLFANEWSRPSKMYERKEES